MNNKKENNLEIRIKRKKTLFEMSLKYINKSLLIEGIEHLLKISFRKLGTIEREQVA